MFWSGSVRLPQGRLCSALLVNRLGRRNLLFGISMSPFRPWVLSSGPVTLIPVPINYFVLDNG